MREKKREAWKFMCLAISLFIPIKYLRVQLIYMCVMKS